MSTSSLRSSVGFVLNPIAGMGRRVGLKGTDGDSHERALALGARPVAPGRTRQFLAHIEHRDDILLLVAPGTMGADYVADQDIEFTVVGSIRHPTTNDDTRRIAQAMRDRDADLLVFVGGDGTARDVCDAVDQSLPAVGVPSGVKVYSAVFATSAAAAAEMLDEFVSGTELVAEEVLDIDEEAFRANRLDARLHGYLLVPSVRRYLQGGKEASSGSASTLENQHQLAESVVEDMSPDVLYLLGPGTTVKAVADELRVAKTLLGVDAVVNGECVAQDVNEKAILELLSRYAERRIVVTPIGGNGFIFGRGNRQFTAEVIRRVGRQNIIVVATRDKLEKLSCLRIDTDDAQLNQELTGYIDVTIGYRYTKLMPLEC